MAVETLRSGTKRAWGSAFREGGEDWQTGENASDSAACALRGKWAIIYDAAPSRPGGRPACEGPVGSRLPSPAAPAVKTPPAPAASPRPSSSSAAAAAPPTPGTPPSSSRVPRRLAVECAAEPAG
ncbi:hypothetical protein P280DRAFT_523727 [Massarina eburnea CBS 473.64]|uniref:Uncharacterized protein n=1 Tax=Massarina eburnea CBS 473.64 TaxID=1395130 RepID=A0A6A6RHY4_9PLEO|nr:hypothetical protein P280DRAFT_523727 [Massarina eburnea CBS 473.64]